jgi:CRP/FNR family transcriptional regulator, cyclic AMP receptor protein
MAGAGFDTEKFLREAGEGRTVLIFKQGTSIFKQSEPAELVYYLQRGRAKETIISDNGREAVVDILEEGNFFGTGALDGVPRGSTVTAVTLCVVTAITRDALAMGFNRPEFVQVFLTYLRQRNSKIEAEKVDLLLRSSEKRLAQKLLELSHVTEAGPSRLIGPEVTQVMLAEMIGTTRPRVNLFLNRLRKMGAITYHKGGIIVMPTLLKVLIEEKSG